MKGTTVAIVAVEASKLAIWETSFARRRTNTSSPAHAIDLIAALATAAVTYVQHLHALRSSNLFTLYLLLSSLADATRSRSCFIRDGLDVAGGLAAATAMCKLIMVGLEEVSKNSILTSDALRKDIGREATSGFISRLLFLFLRPIFKIGFRGQLSNGQLLKLDPELSAKLLYPQISRHWKPESKGKTVSRHGLLKACMGAWRNCFLGLVLCRLIHTAFNFSQPFIFRRVIEFIGKQDHEVFEAEYRGGLVAASAIVFYGLSLSRAAFAHSMNRYVTRLRGGLIALIFQKEHKLTEKEAKMSAAVTLMSADIDGIVEGVPRCLEIPIGMIELGLGVYMLSQNLGVFSLASLAPLITTTAAAIFISRHIVPRFTEWNKSIETRVAKTAGILSQLKAIKILGLGPTVGAFLQRLRSEEIAVSKAFRFLEALSIGPILLGDLMTPVVVIASAYFGHAFNGNMAAEKVFPILTVVSLIQRPLMAVLKSFSTLSAMLACFVRIQDFLRLPEKKPSRKTSNEQQSSGKTIIRACNADIGPGSGDGPILHGANFDLQSGTITGVVGATGSGKTTLMQAVLGDADVTSGSVEVNTTDVGYCGQTVWLRNATIRENVVGHLEYDKDRFDRVMKACFLEEDLKWLPGGEEYIVGTNGSNLSGGQRQRLGIARTAFAEPKLAVLDDAFSSLDSKTAISIFRELCGENGLFRQAGCTVVVVTYLSQCLDLTDQLLCLDSQGAVTLSPRSPLSEHTSRLLVSRNEMDTNALMEESKGQAILRRTLTSANISHWRMPSSVSKGAFHSMLSLLS